MSKTDHDSDSDVSELDAKELSQALSTDQWAPMLGYCEDPETPLTADTFPSKSGGKPVSTRSLIQPNRHRWPITEKCIIIGMVESRNDIGSRASYLS